MKIFQVSGAWLRRGRPDAAKIGICFQARVPYSAGMTSVFRSPTWLLICLAAPLTGPGPRAAQLNFDLYAVGVQVGESVMTVDLSASTYRMGLRYRTTGLARIVSNDSLDQTSAGAFEKDLPVPLEYKSVGKLRGHDRIVTMSYRNRNPVPTLIDPPNEAERDIVPEAHWQGTVDPLSAMAEMLRDAARTGRCDVSQRTYDGRRLEMFEARTVGEDDIASSGRSSFSGRSLRCDYTRQPIAGFRLGSGRAEDSRARHGSFWLAPVAPGGPPLPVRGVIDAMYLGEVTMYLTSVKP